MLNINNKTKNYVVTYGDEYGIRKINQLQQVIIESDVGNNQIIGRRRSHNEVIAGLSIWLKEEKR